LIHESPDPDYAQLASTFLFRSPHLSGKEKTMHGEASIGPLCTKSGEFATTHWSVVLEAAGSESPQAAEALEKLCHTYWSPLYAHVRRRGYVPADAQDLTQEFFVRLLAKRWLSMADPRRGRFRSFLLAALNHFLANEWDRAHYQKRGGSHPHLSFDVVAAEKLYLRDARRDWSAEEIYERNWALSFLEHARRRLREECGAAGKADRFELWERFLPGEACRSSYAEVAAQIGVPEGTFKSEVYRFKQRYGELLREEIAQTVACPQEIDDELRHLIAVLGR
jgi:RNA polymerase sigma-70 factor (ECF subfamily)